MVEGISVESMTPDSGRPPAMTQALLILDAPHPGFDGGDLNNKLTVDGIR